MPHSVVPPDEPSCEEKVSSEASDEPSHESNFHLKVHMKLQMNLFLHMKVHVKVQKRSGFTRAGGLPPVHTLVAARRENRAGIPWLHFMRSVENNSRLQCSACGACGKCGGPLIWYPRRFLLQTVQHAQHEEHDLEGGTTWEQG